MENSIMFLLFFNPSLSVFLSQKFTYEGWADTVVSGWGTISSGGAISNTLKYVKVPPVADGVCNAADSYNGGIISDQMICAGLYPTPI